MLTTSDSIDDLLKHAQTIERDGKTYFWIPRMLEVDDLGAIELHEFGNPNVPVNIQLLQLQMQGNEVQDKIISLCNAMIPHWTLTMVLSPHSCSESPIGLCVYDQADHTLDNPLDSCIYCKNPFHKT